MASGCLAHATHDQLKAARTEPSAWSSSEALTKAGKGNERGYEQSCTSCMLYCSVHAFIQGRATMGNGEEIARTHRSFGDTGQGEFVSTMSIRHDRRPTECRK